MNQDFFCVITPRDVPEGVLKSKMCGMMRKDFMALILE